MSEPRAEPGPGMADVPASAQAPAPGGDLTAAPPRRRARRRRRPDVSVCIVNWNCRALLKACLRSLRPGLQGVRLEVVVVDNGSSDGAADMVSRCFPGVTLIRNGANAGFARANNQAALRARGRYLFFLNNDTRVPPGTLRRFLHLPRANPGAGLGGPPLGDPPGPPPIFFPPRPA